MVQPFHILPSVNLRQHDPAGPFGHDRNQIIKRIRSIQRIDPDPQSFVPVRPRLQNGANSLTSDSLFFGRDSIFQIEQDDVGRTVHRLGHFAIIIARHE